MSVIVVYFIQELITGLAALWQPSHTNFATDSVYYVLVRLPDGFHQQVEQVLQVLFFPFPVNPHPH